MEKRRRERINQSLETLRLLMVENTNNEVRALWCTTVQCVSLARFVGHFLFDLLNLEIGESEGGEGGDSGECGPVPQDGEKDGARPAAHEERRRAEAFY